MIPEVYKRLEQAKVALCLPVSPTVPLDICPTAPWTYIRMHSGQWGTGYSDPELETWAAQIRAFWQQGIEVYTYFNNDPDGHALRDAERLKTFLS